MASEKLIRAKELKEKLQSMRKWFDGPPQTDQDKLAQSVIKMCIEEVDKLKPVDAVEVVLCKDCAHWDAEHCSDGQGWCPKVVGYRHGGWYCAAGERRTDNA